MDVIQEVAIDDFEIDVENLGVDLSDNQVVSQGTNTGYGVWNDKERSESVCDFKDNLHLHKRDDFYYISFWAKSEEGMPLSEVKKDSKMVETFSNKALEIIPAIVGHNLETGHFCLLTAPKRRHKITNFANEVCKRIAAVLQIPFYEDAIIGNRDRIRPVFTLVKPIPEPNVIVFDDIVTTGLTLKAVSKVLYKKNCIFVVGINNN